MKIIGIILLIFAVLGIIGALTQKGESKERKKNGLVGLGLVFVVAIILIGLGSSGGEEEEKQTLSAKVNSKQDEKPEDKQIAVAEKKPEQMKVDIPSYKIESVEDVSVAAAVRLSYNVVVDRMVTEEQIKAIANEVVEKAKKEKPFNAMNLFFVDDARQIGQGYTVAKIEYSPKGVWANAIKVKTGDYSTHEFVYSMGSAFGGGLPKDKKDYPTKEQLDIYFTFREFMNSKDNPIKEQMPLDTKDVKKWSDDNMKRADAYEKQVKDKVAKQYNISLEELDKTILKAGTR